MAKLVVRQPGFFVDIPGVGSFRSPFKVKVPDSLKSLVVASFLKNGIKDFEISDVKVPVEEKKKVRQTEKVEQVGSKVNIDMSEVLKRLDDIHSLVNKVLQKDPTVIIQQEGSASQGKKKEDEEQEMFIPSLSKSTSTIDLSVKTTGKDDISSRVESLSNLKKRRR